MRAKQNLAARMAVVMHVPDFFANEVANHRGADVADQIRGKNESAIQGNQHIQPTPLIFPRDLFSQSGHARSDALRGKCCPRLRLQIFSSVITTPFWVLSLAAQSAAAGKPRAHASTPPLASTGQPSRSQRLTCFSFNKRFSLWECW